MKVLITGGAGFIGSHLADFLLKSRKVSQIIILDNIKDGSLKNLKLSINSKKSGVGKQSSSKTNPNSSFE